MIHILNVVFGLFPTMALAASIASGIDDDRHHRRTFLLVYGLWSITLVMWNWMRSAPVAWEILWSLCALIAIGALIATRGSSGHQQKGS